MAKKQWRHDELMQLPDYVFGRRWPVFCDQQIAGLGSAWDIAEIGLPNYGVIWQFRYIMTTDELNTQTWRVALGDRLPATQAEMDALDPLMQGLGTQGPEPRHSFGRFQIEEGFWDFRMPVAFQSRKMILEVNGVADHFLTCRTVIVVSAMPREVPEWILSERDKSQ